MNKKTILFWIFAVVITLSSAVFQRMTGPTKPYRGQTELGESAISYRLIRTFDRPEDAPVSLKVEDREISGFYIYKRYPSHDAWEQAPLKREGDRLIAHIPQQPAAGKVMYQIYLEKGDDQVMLSEEPIIIRFRDSVPGWAMLPHIILMFTAMLFSTRAGLAALFREKTFSLTLWTFITFVFGGLIFGPIVQKYAFGDFWTGWPWGTDLTDNKTAFAFIFWLIAFIKVYKNPRHRSWVLVASIVLLLIYLIPHSLLGSEIDWTQEGVE